LPADAMPAAQPSVSKAAIAALIDLVGLSWFNAIAGCPIPIPVITRDPTGRAGALFRSTAIW